MNDIVKTLIWIAAAVGVIIYFNMTKADFINLYQSTLAVLKR